jgi:quercetin dioxygenase-like cupin family protein
MHKGAAIKDNTVDGLFQVLVIDGKVRVTTQEGDIEMRENEMITLHPNIYHNIEALKKSTLLLQTVNGKSNGEEIQQANYQSES